MYLLEAVLPTLAENLALDEALLLHAEAGGPEVLRLWEWPRLGVVLGAGGRIADDICEDLCLADGVPIARRSSGGGTVLLGPGCLLYSLVLRFDRAEALTDLHASYRYVLGNLRRGLEPHVEGITEEGSSDLALGDRKFSGNAQQRKRTHFLHHGSLLHDFDLKIVPRYLKAPPRQPPYRRQRSHGEFLTNVPVGAETLREVFCDVWHAAMKWGEWPEGLARQLAEEKYVHDQWIRRR